MRYEGTLKLTYEEYEELLNAIYIKKHICSFNTHSETMLILQGLSNKIERNIRLKQ